MNTFEQFIWNYGIMKDFPMKVMPSRPTKISGVCVCVCVCVCLYLYLSSGANLGGIDGPSIEPSTSLTIHQYILQD